MSQFIAAQCPQCRAPVYPRPDWFQCETCGSYIRFEEDATGLQYMDLGRRVNGQIEFTRRELIHIVHYEGEQTRAEMHIQQEIDKLGFDRLAKVNYLVFLALQRAEVREQMHEFEKKPASQQSSNEVYSLRSKLGTLNRRIDAIDDKVRPDKEEAKKPASSSSDGWIALLVILLIIAFIVILSLTLK